MTPVRDEVPKRQIEFKDTISVEDLFLSDSQEEEVVMRPITELERNTYNAGVVEKTFLLEDLAAEKKVMMADFSLRQKQVKADLSRMTGAIRTGQVRDKDAIHTFLDRDAGKVRKYRLIDGKGVLQSVRSMTPEEAFMDITKDPA